MNTFSPCACISPVLVAGLWLAFAGDVLGGDDSWIDKRVVQKRSNFVIGVGYKPVVESSMVYDVYTVEAIEGSFLWLRSDSRFAGWAKEEDVVPIDDAELYFTLRLNTDPRDAHALAMRGLIRSLKGKQRAALSDVSRSVEAAPTAAAHLLRATLRAEAGETDPAMADFDAAILLEPACASAYAGRSREWFRRKNFTQAGKDADEAVRLDPLNPLRYLARALYRHWGAFREKLADLDEAIRLDPQWAYALSSRGKVHLEAGRLAEALEDFTEAMRLQPSLPDASLGRGLVRISLHQYSEAEADLLQVLEDYPAASPGYEGLAELARAKGELDLAVDLAATAIRLNPANAGASAARARALADQGEYAKASADFERALQIDDGRLDLRAEFARLLATCPDDRFRDGMRAVELASEACVRVSDVKVLNRDILAAAHAEAGDFAAAVKVQADSLAAATDPVEKEEGERRLRMFREHHPYREINAHSSLKFTTGPRDSARVVRSMLSALPCAISGCVAAERGRSISRRVLEGVGPAGLAQTADFR